MTTNTKQRSRPTNSPERHPNVTKRPLSDYPIWGNSTTNELQEKSLQTSKLFSYDQRRSPAIQRASQEPMLHLMHWEAVYTKENFSINVEVTWESWCAIPKTFIKAPKTPDFFGSQRSPGGFQQFTTRKKHLYYHSRREKLIFPSHTSCGKSGRKISRESDPSIIIKLCSKDIK